MFIVYMGHVPLVALVWFIQVHTLIRQKQWMITFFSGAWSESCSTWHAKHSKKTSFLGFALSNGTSSEWPRSSFT